MKQAIILLFFCTVICHSQDKPIYPAPETGFKRVDLALPKIENPENQKVEIRFSTNAEVTECANAELSFPNKNLIVSYAINPSSFPYYSIKSMNAEIIEELSPECKSTKTVKKKIFSFQSLNIEYQSSYAIPFYIPESWNLEYRLGSTENKYMTVTK